MLFTRICQLGFVLPDLAQAASFFTDGLGYGPLLAIRFGAVADDPTFSEGALAIEDCILDGNYVGTYGIYMAAASFPSGIQLELIQPAGNKSLFGDYLVAHGAGLQHLAIESDVPFVEQLGRMALAGNPLASITTVDHAERCAFVHHEAVLGLALETQYRPDDYGMPDGEPPLLHPDRAAHPTPLITDMTGLTLCVPDLGRARTLLESAYEIPGWEQDGADAVCPALRLHLRAGADLPTICFQAAPGALADGSIAAAVQAWGGAVETQDAAGLTATLPCLGCRLHFAA